MKIICILVPLLLLLPPGCGNVLDLRAKSFIHVYYTQRMPWTRAQAYCRVHYTDLVTIRDESENLGFFHGWIGLYREDSALEWKWSRGDKRANFTIWGHNEPDDDDNCAFKYRHREAWRGKKCGSRHSFMCYDERLVLVKEKKTWEEALEHCRALEALDPSKPATAYQNHRYDLATLLTEDDHVFAQEKAQEATTQEVWTGLRYLAGHWVWVGGEAVQHENIKSCPNQKFCGILVKNSTLRIRDCMKKRNFLCYKRKLQTHSHASIL